MFYLALILIAFCIFIIYKEKGDTRIFLFSLVVGWIIAVFCFIIYLQYLEQRELYLSLFVKVLYGTKLLPKIMVPQSGGMAAVITLMNFGILLFIYSSLCFSLSFIKPLRSNTRVYILLAVPPVLQFLFYCPWLYEGVYRVVFSGALRGTMSFQAFYNLDDFLHSATSMVNYMYLLFGLGFMIYHYFKTPKLKYFRSYFLFIFSGYLTIILLFIIFLWWSPKRLISLTTAADSMHILPVSILIEGRMLAYYPYVMLISFVTLLFSLYRFNHLYFDLKNMRNIIVRSFDISNTGIRFFNHMVKNYAMAALIDAETLRSRMPEDPALLPYADRIINTSQDLLRTLNGIQSKISVASLNLSLSNVKEIMDGALALVNLETVTLKYRADEPPPYALLDLGHMKEVFVNILNNAIQAMGPDTRVLTVEIRRDKAWVDISISDTGEGIEKQNLHKIFIPFYSTKNRRDNWGLGLTYCYRIVMAHRGKLYVDSEPGRGTSVKILIPLIEEEQRFEVPGITAGETA